MELSPDAVVYARWGPVALNATLVFTWVVMALLVGVSWVITRNLSSGMELSRGQNLLEVLVLTTQEQIRDISGEDPSRHLGFVGTLFIFIVASNILAIIPGYRPPMGSLSTTAALALCVFVAVPFFGITRRGVRQYLRTYAQPSLLVLPFNIIGELSRTLALAIRLFGNVMSGHMIVAILLTIAPFFFPVLMSLLGLLTGVIQAYIFAVLAMVYIAAASRAQEEQERKAKVKTDG